MDNSWEVLKHAREISLPDLIYHIIILTSRDLGIVDWVVRENFIIAYVLAGFVILSQNASKAILSS